MAHHVHVLERIGIIACQLHLKLKDVPPPNSSLRCGCPHQVVSVYRINATALMWASVGFRRDHSDLAAGRQANLDIHLELAVLVVPGLRRHGDPLPAPDRNIALVGIESECDLAHGGVNGKLAKLRRLARGEVGDGIVEVAPASVAVHLPLKLCCVRESRPPSLPHNGGERQLPDDVDPTVIVRQPPQSGEGVVKAQRAIARKGHLFAPI